jgi:hypothetical protein
VYLIWVPSPEETFMDDVPAIHCLKRRDIGIVLSYLLLVSTTFRDIQNRENLIPWIVKSDTMGNLTMAKNQVKTANRTRGIDKLCQPRLD